jgi:hypothetical protein
MFRPAEEFLHTEHRVPSPPTAAPKIQVYRQDTGGPLMSVVFARVCVIRDPLSPNGAHAGCSNVLARLTVGRA